MAGKTKKRQISIVREQGAFTALLRRFSRDKEDYDLDSLKALRSLLSNEKAKILHIVKNKNPKSIYELAKNLKRDFKSVSNDVKLLERFGFVELISEKSGERERLKPILSAETISIELKI